MAEIDDPNPPEGFVAWYRRVAYNPPAKDFDYDEMLRTNPPPFVPYVANRTLWKRF